MKSIITALSSKLVKFEVSGLKSYRKYVMKQLKDSEGKKGKKAYNNYLKKVLARVDKKLAKKALA